MQGQVDVQRGVCVVSDCSTNMIFPLNMVISRECGQFWGPHCKNSIGKLSQKRLGKSGKPTREW